MSLQIPHHPNYFVVDTFSEANTGWHDGAKVYVKGSDEFYILDGGTFNLMGTVGATTDHAALSSLAYATAGHTGFQALDTGLTSLAGLAYASTSFVKMTGADTFSLDTATYESAFTKYNLAGTANQVSLSDSGTGVLLARNITLSLPQSIATASTPTFGGLTLNGALDLTGVTGNVSLFDDELIGDAVDGNSLYIRRHASEGDNNIRFHVDKSQNGNIICTNNLYITGGGASTDGLGVYGCNFELFRWENANRTLKQYGYITAAGAEKYVQWQVDDSDDYFNLTRVDGNILGFKVAMPVTLGSAPTDAITTTGNIELGHATDTTISRVSSGLIAVEGKTLLSDTSTAGVGNSPNANGTQTITHGLGRTPTIIRITGFGNKASGTSATNQAESTGIWCSSGNCCVYRLQGASAGQASSIVYAIRVGSGATADCSGVIGNVGATTFDIVWTETGTSDTTPVYLWEAQ